VWADDDDKNKGLRADPFVFVGKAGDCGPGYPAGSRIVTSAWLGGMGLPDNGGSNVGTVPNDNPNKNDPHRGLLLNKNGTTADCSSAGARITGVKGMPVDATFTLGYDYRNGGHCGAGAPRFNVVAKPPSGPNTSHFVGGCGNDNEAIPAPQDPAQWTRVRHINNAADAEFFPPIAPGSTIVSITLIYDEGTDTPSASDPQGVGLAVVDNIFINGKTITNGQGVADGPNGNGNGNGNGHGNDDDDD